MQPSVGGGLAVLAVEKDGTAVEILQDGSKPSDGWLAIGYEKKVRAPVIRYRTYGRLPIALHTLLIPLHASTMNMQVDVEPVCGRVRSSVSQAFLVKLGSRRDVIFFSSAAGMIPFYREWLTDAHVVWINLDEQGDIGAFVLINGSSLVVGERDLLRLDRQIPFAAFSLVDGYPVLELSESAKVMTSFLNARIMVSGNAEGGIIYETRSTCEDFGN